MIMKYKYQIGQYVKIARKDESKCDWFETMDKYLYQVAKIASFGSGDDDEPMYGLHDVEYLLYETELDGIKTQNIEEIYEL